MAERQEALREFVAVTGTEDDRARFFLESAGWDLQVAPRGRLRRAGRGLRGAGAWHVQPAVAEAHSHPSGPRPDTGLRGLRPLARRFQRGSVVGNRGAAPARPCLASVSPPASPGRWASETRALQPPAWMGDPGGVAAAPILGRSSGRGTPPRGRGVVDGHSRPQEEGEAGREFGPRPLPPRCWENLPPGRWRRAGMYSSFLVTFPVKWRSRRGDCLVPRHVFNIRKYLLRHEDEPHAGLFCVCVCFFINCLNHSYLERCPAHKKSQKELHKRSWPAYILGRG